MKDLIYFNKKKFWLISQDKTKICKINNINEFINTHRDGLLDMRIVDILPSMSQDQEENIRFLIEKETMSEYNPRENFEKDICSKCTDASNNDCENSGIFVDCYNEYLEEQTDINTFNKSGKIY